MVKDHSDREEREETLCCHMDYSFRLAARVLLYASSHRGRKEMFYLTTHSTHPTESITCITAFVTPVVEH